MLPPACRSLAALLILSSVSGTVAAQTLPARGGQASVVVGTVFDHETGEPLAAVLISLGRGPGGTFDLQTRLTDSLGHFAFPRVEPGTYVIRASLLGRQTLVDTFSVVPEADERLVLKLAIHPVDMQPLRVTVVRARPVGDDWMQGFDERRVRRQGIFITAGEIEERKPEVLSDLLRTVPGARFLRLPHGGYSMRMADGCRPVFWLNGQRMMGDAFTAGIDAFVPPDEVEAVEVYTHPGDVPIQFGPTSCGAVVIWTHPPRSGPFRKVRWRAISFGAGLIALGIALVFLR